MTPKRWLVLLSFYISYLFLGASIYYYIEHNLEREARANALEQRIEINEYLAYHLNDKDGDIQDTILNKITDYCGKPVTNYTLDKYEDPYRWTFYHSLFFAFTVCSTVGYGNLSPSTTLGRMIMIVYSLIGIPINGILFAILGEYFTRFFTSIYKRYKDYKMANDDKYVPRKFGLFATILIALVPGITFFIILPSVLFSYFEDWPFSLSIYYSYVTTTTIGFGDYVPTFQTHQEREFGIYFIFYQIFIIIWFIFSLGYVVMIMTFITRGLRSKKLTYLEHQLKDQIKVTQHRIWHGVSKDISYLRQILNELYINARHVYQEQDEKFISDIPRSSSCPDLQMYKVPEFVYLNRKRAFSESFDQMMDRDQLANGTPIQNTIIKGSSESDLYKINKQRTFDTVNAFKETTTLLASVVTALGNIKPPASDDDNASINTAMFGGYHGFSDSQILSSESYPQAANPLFTGRSRACSDFHLNPKTIATSLNNEWTWSGDNDQIQQVINDRARIGQKKPDSLYKSSLQNSKLAAADSVLINMENTESQMKKRKFSTDSLTFIKRLFKYKNFDSLEDLESSKKKHSTVSVPDEPKSFLPIDSPYSTVQPIHPAKSNNNMDILPKTENGSIYKRIDARNNSLAKLPQSNRRDSILTDRRKNSSAFIRGTNRRGSLFVGPNNSNILKDRRCSSRSFDKRGSLFSVPSEEELLENTSIADIIRALEILHSQLYLGKPELDNKEKKRKLGTSTPPTLPTLFTIFSNSDIENNNAERRPSIYGNTNQAENKFNNILSEQRRSSMFGNFFSSSRSTLENNPQINNGEAMRKTSEPFNKDPPTTKFKRFTVRPVNDELSYPSQTVLQRRLSLRPSPLARQNFGQSSFIKSSAQTPLSRIAQIQSIRKNSKADLEPKSE